MWTQCNSRKVPLVVYIVSAKVQLAVRAASVVVVVVEQKRVTLHRQQLTCQAVLVVVDGTLAHVCAQLREGSVTSVVGLDTLLQCAEQSEPETALHVSDPIQCPESTSSEGGPATEARHSATPVPGDSHPSSSSTPRMTRSGRIITLPARYKD
ncbi:hypothetical protein C0Q70_12281 [Pomacea canaliculata]|uniref:Uncharacterized protein n=1 Tax=Pomacea canaliculata TaxID=400727 RepID=A0A2T7P149_POMCA|nr:hypothetical protein C0Q70_12281 [Pomacea canaliculata]